MDPRYGCHWRTIACGLARYPRFAQSLVQVLEESTIDPERAEIALHFRYFIQETLTRSYDSNIPINDTPCHHNRRFGRMSRAKAPKKGADKLSGRPFASWEHLPKKLKLVVTSRDESFIPQKFRSISHPILLPLLDGTSIRRRIRR